MLQRLTRMAECMAGAGIRYLTSHLRHLSCVNFDPWPFVDLAVKDCATIVADKDG